VKQPGLFDYCGPADAEPLVILMGPVQAPRKKLWTFCGSQLLKARLFRPFAAEAFLSAIPSSVKSIAVLDRTKEPGSLGEPLYQDVLTGYMERLASNGATGIPRIIGGRYGLSSKEFTPAMVKAVFDELKKSQPNNHFTVGIHDDVTHTSLEYDADFSTEDPRTVRALFYGLGSDGTVGANKNSTKIIGKGTGNFAQEYFVYDSKKAGAVTVAHPRFGTEPVRSTYLITKANFVACHQFQFMDRIVVLAAAEPGATFLLNAPFSPEEIWNHIPRQTQEIIILKKLRIFAIDGYAVARAAGPVVLDYESGTWEQLANSSHAIGMSENLLPDLYLRSVEWVTAVLACDPAMPQLQLLES
jgi:pyruvate-ferredoxin/flavodoxin oxidoreductase